MSVLVVDENPADVAFLQQLLIREGLDRVFHSRRYQPNHEQQALTRALLAFAYEVGAEGIEEPAELNALQDLGVSAGDRATRSADPPRDKYYRHERSIRFVFSGGGSRRRDRHGG